MAKKKSVKKGLMMTAKVVDIKQFDDGMGVALNDGERKQPFVVYFQVVDEELGIGDLVTVTIVRSEE
jgi:hypothetical protein